MRVGSIPCRWCQFCAAPVIYGRLVCCLVISTPNGDTFRADGLLHVPLCHFYSTWGTSLLLAAFECCWYQFCCWRHLFTAGVISILLGAISVLMWASVMRAIAVLLCPFLCGRGHFYAVEVISVLLGSFLCCLGNFFAAVGHFGVAGVCAAEVCVAVVISMPLL